MYIGWLAGRWEQTLKVVGIFPGSTLFTLLLQTNDRSNSMLNESMTAVPSWESWVHSYVNPQNCLHYVVTQYRVVACTFRQKGRQLQNDEYKWAHNPKDHEKARSFGWHWCLFWKTSPARKHSTCTIKGRQAASLKNQQEVYSSGRSVCRHRYARKEEKEDQANKHEATGQQ